MQDNQYDLKISVDVDLSKASTFSIIFHLGYVLIISIIPNQWIYNIG